MPKAGLLDVVTDSSLNSPLPIHCPLRRIWASAARRLAVASPSYRLGSERGSPNHGNTLFSKRVMAQIRSPVRVRTNRPVPWRVPLGARR
jgi:hypothetical protein